MQIDFYYWGGMCPISDEIIQMLSRWDNKFDIRLHDITNDFDLAKNKSMFFPFLTIVNHKERYYGPVSEAFLQTLSTGMLPKETPYRITMGTVEKSEVIQPIHKDNYFLASQCTGRRNCSGCSSKVKMYQDFPDGIIGFMNMDNETLLGGAEYVPSLYVPYDIPKGQEIAFITCVYLSDETFDYKSAPLRALEQYLSKRYKKAIVISDEEGTFPNGDLQFFEKNGYHDEKVIFEDRYCRLHLLVKDLI
ncbi:MAG: hypothetical protein HDQ98_03850 [Lachnospiraceae bacterium]|nr:hypothetical protein [Lachnospiraceae bacterium]